MNTPRVSVLMPVYNAMPYLQESVTSILNQTYSDFEFLVFDDASTDGSAEWLDGIRDDRFRVVHYPKQGYTSLLNLGLQMAGAPYVARMDADDVSLPERLEKQIELLEKRPEVVACGCQLAWIDAEGKELRSWEEWPLSWGEALGALLVGGTPLSHPGSMFRLRDAIAIGGYDPAQEPAEDLDLWWRLADRGRLLNHPDLLLKYRKHSLSVCSLRTSEQRRVARSIMIRHLIRTGVASSESQANNYLHFVSPPGKNATTVSRAELAAFNEVCNRLRKPTAHSFPLDEESVYSVERCLRWAS